MNRLPPPDERRGPPLVPPARGAGKAKVVVWIFVLLLAAAGLGMLALSFSLGSHERIRNVLDTYAADGDADWSEDQFRTLVTRLRLLGAGLVLFGAAIAAGRAHVQDYLSRLFASFSSSTKHLGAHLRAVIAREATFHLFALLIIILVGILVRFRFLSQPMRYDEAVTFNQYASEPLYIALTHYSAPNNHLFHTLLVHLSQLILGDAPWAIRLPAFLAGALLVPATYVLGRLLYDKHAGLLASALVASSSILIEYSTNARGYTIVCLIFLLLLALAVHLRQGGEEAAWFAFAVLTAIGFYTIPIMLYPFGVVAVWVALSALAEGERRGREVVRRLALSLVLAGVLTSVLYAPVFAVSGPASVFANDFVRPMGWSEFVAALPHHLSSVWLQWHRDLPVAIGAALTLAFLAALALHPRLSRLRVALPLAAILWIVPVLALQRGLRYERVWLFLLPLYLIMAAAALAHVLEIAGRRTRPQSRGLSRVTRTSLVSVLAVTLGAAVSLNVVAQESIYRSRETGVLPDALRIATFLGSYLNRGDRVLAAGSDQPLEYYFELRGLDAAAMLYTNTRPERVVAVVATDQTLPEVLEWAAGARVPVTHHARVLRAYDGATLYRLEAPANTESAPPRPRPSGASR